MNSFKGVLFRKISKGGRGAFGMYLDEAHNICSRLVDASNTELREKG